jgi:hypothetical protein
MYVFVDESGTNKSTGVCVFAAVLVDTDALHELNQLVTAAEKSAGVRSFHWKDAPWPVRMAFIRGVSKGKFIVRHQLSKNPLRNFGEALESLLMTASEGMTVERIILDGRKDKSYERRLKKILRDKGLSSKRLRTANDESYPVLRVADAMAGLLRAHTNKPTDATAVMMKSLNKCLQ